MLLHQVPSYLSITYLPLGTYPSHMAFLTLASGRWQGSSAQKIFNLKVLIPTYLLEKYLLEASPASPLENKQCISSVLKISQ